MSAPALLLAVVLAAGGPAPRGDGWKRDFSGTIGHGLKVRVELESKGAPSYALSGSYVYEKKGVALRLDGRINEDGSFTLSEQDRASKTSGAWDGRMVEDGVLVGIWTDPERTRSLAFELHPAEAVTPPPAGPGEVQVLRQHALLSRRQDDHDNCLPCHAWVFYPEVRGSFDARIATKVRRAVSPKRGFGRSLDELRADFADDLGSWEDFDFNVTFNRGGLLSLAFEQTVTEAYPVTTRTRVNVDLRTGDPLKPSDVLTPEGIGWVLPRLNRELAAAVKEAIVRMKADNDDPDLLAVVRAARFSKQDLSHSLLLTETGLAFDHPIELPHAFQGDGPRTEFEIPWAELAGHLTTAFAERLR